MKYCIAITLNNKKFGRCPNYAVNGKCFCSSHKYYWLIAMIAIIGFLASMFGIIQGTEWLCNKIKTPPIENITNFHGNVTIENTDHIAIDSARVFIVGKEHIFDYTKNGRYNIDIKRKKDRDTIYTIIVQKENYISEEKTITKAELINGKDIDIKLRPQK